MPFHPGLMGDAGAPPDQMPPEFADSMAAAIERAFSLIREKEGLARLETSSNATDVRDRRMLFVAIAQGVSWYLSEHPEALKVMPTSSGPSIDFQVDSTELLAL